ncbi:MAG TPA: hypothetical protein VGO93_04365 [Candidatus Xenobia bacterium]|jgi:hypothetical protein
MADKVDAAGSSAPSAPTVAANVSVPMKLESTYSSGNARDYDPTGGMAGLAKKLACGGSGVTITSTQRYQQDAMRLLYQGRLPLPTKQPTS